MKEIKRIIVAIDFSVYSRQVLEYAAEIAQRTSAEIVAINVINKRLVESVKKVYNEEHHGAFLREKFVGDEMRKRKLKLAELINEIIPKQIPTRILIRDGIPFEQIIEIINNENADLVVMAPKGRTNLPEYLFGTTSEKIFRHSPVPVLSLSLREK